MKVFRIQASVMSSVLVVSTLMFIGMLGVKTMKTLPNV